MMPAYNLPPEFRAAVAGKAADMLGDVGVQRVFVVNMPGAGLGDVDLPGRSGGKSATTSAWEVDMPVPISMPMWRMCTLPVASNSMLAIGASEPVPKSFWQMAQGFVSPVFIVAPRHRLEQNSPFAFESGLNIWPHCRQAHASNR